jgi:hypothetical protein
MRKIALAVAFCWIASSALVASQQSPEGQNQKPDEPMASCPMHDAHSKMNQRGEKAMGFSQTATTHHFFLKPDGGVIQVEANDPGDKTNRDEIRMHLTHIADAFAKGDFDIPMFVHDTVPPGEPEMKQLREKIQYLFEESPKGGRVLITSTDQDALVAIHKFLRFQIEEHKTGDKTEVR